MRFGKGVKTRLVLEAIQRRAEHYAELEAMTPEQRAEHDAGIEAIKAMLPKPAQPDIEMLASALTNAPLAPSDRQGRPRAPVVPEECKEAPAYVKALTKEGAYIYGFNACRAAMLQAGNHTEQHLDMVVHSGDANKMVAGNSPVTPDCWIPVSERMPEESGRYWCYVEEQNSLGKSHFQWNCSWNGERWWIEGGDGGTVTHWMPLPAAPQQEVK
ncbi:DUF551 domain-containing protein [Salmonella enterica subsp. enterica]|nr:DUF551 domain-containing protein [Salmonella enterica]ECB3971283.1 DUF551 domain-containing protein [Salmonella enterica subsp. enterica serovar Lexington]ECC3314435.1 DUF551 domain-containing protein [Salmonella enterica subsp. enterica]EDW0190544.1 DUF551 domain-containing protein [Salmonella enterica subsp. enterica serovar Orion]EDX3404870.1 DUF551 domain-containing protein [Salmonella enterica subsp. enterica serovar Weltevreden]